ncbi:DUF7344 domain-containing protein [Halomarina rubra]|uniref:DUF7344 domain-containing protein n=1 Tax=Halomarina rubra TaxID=2071873 RepID=A0ABD6AVE3_9EURY|nr:hypothetical protein [Halomarina rubra]
MAQNGLRRPTTDSPTARTTPDADHTFRLLADDERRTLLGAFEEAEHVAVEDLRDHIAADADDRDHASIRLHHVHLPKLADAGLLDVDADGDVVTPTDRGRALASRLEA